MILHEHHEVGWQMHVTGYINYYVYDNGANNKT